MRNLLILFALASVLFSGCQTTPSTENNPQGLSVEEMTEILTSQKWRYDIPRIREAMDSLKSHTPPTQFQLVESSINRVQFGVFEFAPENILWLDLNNGSEKVQGNWAFSKDGKSLMITFSTTKATPQPIKHISKEKIELDLNIDAGALYPKIFIPVSEGAGKQRINPSQEAPKDTVQ